MTTNVQIPAHALTPKIVAPFVALCYMTRTTLNRLAEQGGKSADLYAEAQRLGLTPSGPSQWLYVGASGDDNQEFELNILLPVQQIGVPSTAFSYKELPTFSCVTYEHRGAWREMPAVYDQLFEQFYRDGYSEGNIVREVYHVVDLEHPEQCVTEVQISTR